MLGYASFCKALWFYIFLHVSHLHLIVFQTLFFFLRNYGVIGAPHEKKQVVDDTTWTKMHFDWACLSVSTYTNTNAWMHTAGHERNEHKHTNAKIISMGRTIQGGFHWRRCRVCETGATLWARLCSVSKGELQGNSSKEAWGEVCVLVDCDCCFCQAWTSWRIRGMSGIIRM